MSIVSQLICDTCGQVIEGGVYVTVRKSGLPNATGGMLMTRVPKPEQHYHENCVSVQPVYEPESTTEAAEAAVRWAEVAINTNGAKITEGTAGEAKTAAETAEMATAK